MAQAKEFDHLWNSYWLAVQRVGPLTHTRFRLMLQEFPHEMPPGTRVLDAGCGTGNFLRTLQQRYPLAELQGIEFSQSAATYADPSVAPLIAIGDVMMVAPSLPQASYDVIVCSEVLEHVDDPGEVLSALTRLARPGAKFIFTVPAGMCHWSAQDDEAHHRRRFEIDEFAELLERQGLICESLYTWGGPIAWAYNRAINVIGPNRAAHAGSSRFGQLVASLLTLAMRMDDVFKGRRGFQLIASARNPAPVQ